MASTIRPFLALVLVAACGAPTSVAPGPEQAQPSPEGRTATPVESLAFETEAPAVATEPPAPPAAAVTVTELAPAAAPAGNLLADRPAARLVPLGGSLRGYAGGIANKVRRAMGPPRRARPAAKASVGMGALDSLEAAPPPPSPAASPAAAPARNAEPAAEAGGAESVTNVQVAGVDEGGIVKAWREFLIVLRRGRLFTIRLGDAPGAATPVAGIDVRPPRARDHDAWYDEMLVHDATGTIVVIGFSYEDEATEIGLFRIAPDGTLTHRGTHLLRSNDYYSSRNYASRLVGDTLVFYMPHYLVTVDDAVRVSLPQTKPLGGGSWRSIVTDSEVYRISGVEGAATLHTVVTCDLGAPTFGCRARGIIGGEGRTFFVSRDAIYVWVMPEEPVWTRYDDSYDEQEEDHEAFDPSRLPSHLFRLPLDGSRPSALVVRGSPIDQFSFNETARDLWVLVQAEGSGDAMWAPEVSSGALGLVRIPLATFSTDAQDVRVLTAAAYRTLPSPVGGPGRSGSIQNRFVGDYLLYGEGVLWGGRQPGSQAQDRIFLHRYDDGRTFVAALPSGADRIEAMGGDAVVIGTDGANLHFRAFELGAAPVAAGAYVQQGAAQGETRSHGFFYRPTGERQGILGLPTTTAGRPGVRQLVEGSAAVLYLAVDQLNFAQLGELRAEATSSVDDRCEVSCTDWYGNARPLFYRGRVFALLGYELVEGRVANGAITEVARSSMLAVLPPQQPIGVGPNEVVEY